jgi:hypothetical protein
MISPGSPGDLIRSQPGIAAEAGYRPPGSRPGAMERAAGREKSILAVLNMLL